MHHAALQQLAHIAKGSSSNGNETYYETFTNVAVEPVPPPSAISSKGSSAPDSSSNTSLVNALDGDSLGSASQGCLFIIGREATLKRSTSMVVVPSGTVADASAGSARSGGVDAAATATTAAVRPRRAPPPPSSPLPHGTSSTVAAGKPISLALPTTLNGEEPAAFSTSTNSSFVGDPNTPVGVPRLVPQSSVFALSEDERTSPAVGSSWQGPAKVKGSVRTTPASGGIVKGQVVHPPNPKTSTPREQESAGVEHPGHTGGERPDLHAAIVWSPQSFLAHSFPSLWKAESGSEPADELRVAEPTELVCLLSEHIVKIEAALHHTTERRRIYMLAIHSKVLVQTDPLHRTRDSTSSPLHHSSSADDLTGEKVFRFVFFSGGTMRFLRALTSFRPHLVTEELVASLSEGAGTGGTGGSSPSAASSALIAETSGGTGHRHRGWGRAFRLFSGAKQIGTRYYQARTKTGSPDQSAQGPNAPLSSATSNAASPDHSQQLASGMDDIASSASEDLTVPSARQPGTKLNVLTAEMWASCFLPGPAGILDAEKWRVLREQCFLDCSTMDAAVRLEVWGYCLGLYPIGSTQTEREEYLQDQQRHYATLTQQWQSIYPEQESHFSVYRTNKDKISKDVVRTERSNPFFAEESGEGLLAVRHVLMAHLLYNLDLAYCQGMSDVAAVLALLTDADEATSFVYFKLLLERHMKHNFTMTSVSKEQFNKFVQQWIPKTPVCANGVAAEALPAPLAVGGKHAPSGLLFYLKELQVLVRHFLPELYACLLHAQCEDMSFCFQCLITSFKRELDINSSVLLWDSMLCCPYHEDFALYVLLGLLRAHSSTAELRHHYFYSSDRVIKFMSNVRMPVEELVWGGVDMLVEAVTEAARLDGLLRGNLEARVHLDTSLEEVVGLCMKFDGEL